MTRRIPCQSLVLPYLAGLCVYLTIMSPYFGISGLICFLYTERRMRGISGEKSINERNHLNTARCFGLLSVIISGFILYALYGA